jgi:hypothetical protein
MQEGFRTMMKAILQKIPHPLFSKRDNSGSTITLLLIPFPKESTGAAGQGFLTK